jgi:hypothetical protein
MNDQASQSAGPAPARIYQESELRSLAVDELIERLIRDEDRAPRALIDACAARGAEMVEGLAALVAPDRRWNDDHETSGEWWLRLHAVMILGLIPGERAARLLVSFMRRMERANDRDLQGWLFTYWPALFRNKPDTVLPALRELAHDRSVDAYMRVEATEVILARGEHEGPHALDAALDWVAKLVADESEDWEFRLRLGNDLLDFPRARYRALLEDLAKRQRAFGAYFTPSNVRKAYATALEKGQWRNSDDPWEFYRPHEIAQRQQRWAELESGESADDPDAEGFAEFVRPFVREAPKVGRNDPCPCGSGKKYKKCCMGNEK